MILVTFGKMCLWFYFLIFFGKLFEDKGLKKLELINSPVSHLNVHNMHNIAFLKLQLIGLWIIGRYYNKNQLKSRKRLKNRTRNKNFSSDEEDLVGSFSNKRKKSKLKYAFLQPQEPPQVDIDTCKTPGTISSFQFMNFALAAATLAGKISLICIINRNCNLLSIICNLNSILM